MDEPHSFLDCLNAKLLESLKMVVHGFEFFGGAPLPIRDLTYDPKFQIAGSRHWVVTHPVQFLCFAMPFSVCMCMGSLDGEQAGL